MKYRRVKYVKKYNRDRFKLKRANLLSPNQNKIKNTKLSKTFGRFARL